MAFEQVTLRTVEGQEYGPVAMETMVQWYQAGRVPANATLVDAETGDTRPVNAFLAFQVPPPPMPAAGGVPSAAMNAPTSLDHLVPTKNPKALIAYYTSIAGLLCCFIGGPAALILGIMGVKDAKTLGVGRTHGIVGIILGGLETLVAIGLLIALIVSGGMK